MIFNNQSSVCNYTNASNACSSYSTFIIDDNDLALVCLYDANEPSKVSLCFITGSFDIDKLMKTAEVTLSSHLYDHYSQHNTVLCLVYTCSKTNIHTLKSKHQKRENRSKMLGKHRHADWLFRAGKSGRFQSRFLTVYQDWHRLSLPCVSAS